ncbi:MAG: BON domain-containing protein [Candidatus Solibacter sp.]
MYKTLASFLALFLLLFAGAAMAQKGTDDDSLYDAVRVKLASDQVIGSVAFNVAVEKGVVTLSGIVEKESYRDRALRIAKKVKGVKQVVDKVEIKSRVSAK